MNNIKLFLLAIQTSVSILICRALDGEAIIGGDHAPQGKYPYHVAILRYRENICGGGLINDNHVITAAHCVADENGSFFNDPLIVVGGTNFLNDSYPGYTETDVEKVYIPLRYKTDYKLFKAHDIAVLKLFDSFDFGPGTYLKMPAALETHTGEYATVTGFGWNQIQDYRDAFDGRILIDGESDNKLRFAKVKVLSKEECLKQRASRLFYYYRLCGQMVQRNSEEPEGICTGDSGSPLVLNNEIIGVVNTSPTLCTEENRSAMYARVSLYIDFVRNCVSGNTVESIISAELPIQRIEDGAAQVGTIKTIEIMQ